MVNLIMTHFIYFKFQVHTLTDFRDIKININFKKGEMVQKILKENNQDKKVQDKVIPIYCPHPLTMCGGGIIISIHLKVMK